MNGKAALVLAVLLSGMLFACATPVPNVALPGAVPLAADTVHCDFFRRCSSSDWGR